MIDLDSVIGAMDGSAKKDIVFDLSPFYKSWRYGSSESQDKEGFEKKLRETFDFISKEKMDKVISEIFIFHSHATEEIILKLISYYMEDFKSISSVKVTNTKFTDKTLLLINVVHNKKLSEIGDYEETRYPNSNRVNLNQDTIYFRKDNDIIVKLHKSVMTDPLDWMQGYTPTYILSFDTILDLYNIKPWPTGFTYNTPLTLYDGGIIRETVKARDIAEITVKGDFKISADLPIDVSDCDTLIFKGDGTLVLEAKGLQPCIGSRTHEGMSYGRWSPGPVCKCKKIYVIGCTVICKSEVENFALGRYGTNEMPEIELEEGGHLICPEWQNTRYIEYQASPPCGSTKISEGMKYGLR